MTTNDKTIQPISAGRTKSTEPTSKGASEARLSVFARDHHSPASLYLSTCDVAEIPLTRGHFAIIDRLSSRKRVVDLTFHSDSNPVICGRAQFRCGCVVSPEGLWLCTSHRALTEVA